MTQDNADSEGHGGGGCLALLWFDGALLAGAAVVVWPVMSLAAFACPSGGPDCGVGHSLLLLFGYAAAIAAVFTVLVLGLERLGRRWAVARLAYLILGLALLAVPTLALVRSLLVGDAWLLFALTAIWLVVPAVAILADARAILRRRRD